MHHMGTMRDSTSSRLQEDEANFKSRLRTGLEGQHIAMEGDIGDSYYMVIIYIYIYIYIYGDSSMIICSDLDLHMKYIEIYESP